MKTKIADIRSEEGKIWLGQVSTPQDVIDIMVEKLFKKRRPRPNDQVLDPGCGDGAFIKGILRWCSKKKIKPPRIVGVESDPKILKEAQESLKNYSNVSLLNKDFLLEEFEECKFIIGNPPYIRIENINESKRDIYRKRFRTARNRFDLYILFFEKALKCLAPSGRLVFITPEKYEYTLTTEPLRILMASYHVVEIHHLAEDVFGGYVTYPVIITIDNVLRKTKVIHRNGSKITVTLSRDGSPWLPAIQGERPLMKSKVKLKDVSKRISCGIATGMDEVFVILKDQLTEGLKPFAYPTVSGKQLTTQGIKLSSRILVPYDRSGRLLPENRLGELGQWLSNYKDALTGRYCVLKGKRKWYAFHEHPPMCDLLKPKIMCKDIAKEPMFWLDQEGGIIPRHSVYYILPKNPEIMPKLLNYLNSEAAYKWLLVHSQRASNNFIRLQSNTLKKLPVPEELNY